jgi:putative FmdB family regulatory protein
MPTYDYACRACGHEFEEFQSITAPVMRKCPKCGKLKLERLIGTGAGIIFKGGGFYETDRSRVLRNPPRPTKVRRAGDLRNQVGFQGKEDRKLLTRKPKRRQPPRPWRDSTPRKSASKIESKSSRAANQPQE